jgi:hypothetical protein
MDVLGINILVQALLHMDMLNGSSVQENGCAWYDISAADNGLEVLKWEREWMSLGLIQHQQLSQQVLTKSFLIKTTPQPHYYQQQEEK